MSFNNWLIIEKSSMNKELVLFSSVWPLSSKIYLLCIAPIILWLWAFWLIGGKLQFNHTPAHSRWSYLSDCWCFYSCRNQLAKFMEGLGSNIMTLTAGLSQTFRHLEKYPVSLQELERNLEVWQSKIQEMGNKRGVIMVYLIGKPCWQRWHSTGCFRIQRSQCK